MSTSFINSRADVAPADAELLAQFVESQDAETFRALVERWGPAVWRLCVRVTRQRQDAEDAFQITLVTLIRQAPRIRRRQSLSSWLYGVALRTSLRVRYKRDRRRECELAVDVVGSDDSGWNALDDDTFRVLHDELAALPGKYREPLVLRYWLGESVPQLSATLGLSPTVAKGRLQRARNELRSRLALRGIVGLSLATMFASGASDNAAAQTAVAEWSERLWTAAGRGAAENVIPLAAHQSWWRTLFQEQIAMRTFVETITVGGCVLAAGLCLPPRTQLMARSPDVVNVGLAQNALAQEERTGDTNAVEVAFAAAAERTALQYGDGTPDGKKSIAGSGEMIHFTAPVDNSQLSGIELHGARYGTPKAPTEKFKVYVLSSDRTQILHTELVPYERFERGESKWVPLTFAKGIAVPRDFWIVVDFDAQATKGVYVSYDTSTGGEHSMTGLPGSDAKKTAFGGDWMIRAVVER